MLRNNGIVKRVILISVLAVTIVASAILLLADVEPEQRQLRLIFFSDVHARTEWGTPEALAMAARAINAQEADLVIVGGDLITDGFQSSAAAVEHRWDEYMSMHDSLDGEVHAVIGNHDLVAALPEDGTEPSADPRAVFRERLGIDRTYYSFDIRGYHVILLDSIHVSGPGSKYQGLIWPEELQWLREDLREVPADQPIILALHIPLLTTFYQATKGSTAAAPASRVVVNNLEVLEAFRNHNLVLVLQGHLHVAEHMNWQGINFVTGGALSGRWWRGSWHGTPEGFTLISLREDRIKWDYLTYGWQARRPPNE